ESVGTCGGVGGARGGGGTTGAGSSTGGGSCVGSKSYAYWITAGTGVPPRRAGSNSKSRAASSAGASSSPPDCTTRASVTVPDSSITSSSTTRTGIVGGAPGGSAGTARITRGGTTASGSSVGCARSGALVRSSAKTGAKARKRTRVPPAASASCERPFVPARFRTVQRKVTSRARPRADDPHSHASWDEPRRELPAAERGRPGPMVCRVREQSAAREPGERRIGKGFRAHDDGAALDAVRAEFAEHELLR